MWFKRTEQFTDYILNGEAHGDVANRLMEDGLDPGMSRPYINEYGRKCVSILTGRKEPVFNAKTKEVVGYRPVEEEVEIRHLIANGRLNPTWNAGMSLRKEEWITLDQAVLREARLRLRAWADLAGASNYGGFDGFSSTILEHMTVTDPGEAAVDMDGVTPGRDDSPIFYLEGVPLPITHSNFKYTRRELAVSRKQGQPLDTFMVEACTRRVVEMVERTLIGTVTGITYGSPGSFVNYGRTPSVYGYTNFPARLTKTNLTAPTTGGWNTGKTLAEVLAARDQLLNNRFYGPFMVYHSTDWDQYMDNDYILTGGNVATQTLRNRLRAPGMDIVDVRRLDFLDKTTNPFTLLFVQLTPDVAQAVEGMGIRTSQWEGKGGEELFFKVQCIMVPRLRATAAARCGILHATTA